MIANRVYHFRWDSSLSFFAYGLVSRSEEIMDYTDAWDDLLHLKEDRKWIDPPLLPCQAKARLMNQGLHSFF